MALSTFIARLHRQALKYKVQIVIATDGLWIVCERCDKQWKVDLSDLEGRARMPNGIYSCACSKARIAS